MSRLTTNAASPTIPNPNSRASEAQRKPRVSLGLASAMGLGYLPKAPGTFGALAGVALSGALVWLCSNDVVAAQTVPWIRYGAVVFIAGIGVISADRAARFSGCEDPQFVVIDEVSGQMITYFFPLTVLNWKSWLLGFILFRVFDIWKPFPARQAESLPGGWGIMADDWIAGIYAALALSILRVAGL